MASNASRGAAQKARTKKWLEAKGYQVGDLEIVRWAYRYGKPTFATKKDQFGADLLAVNGDRVLFVQVKSGEAAAGGTFPDARRLFECFQLPLGSVQVIVGWAPRARIPRVMGRVHRGVWQEGLNI